MKQPNLSESNRKYKLLERYFSIVDDEAAFRDALSRPMPGYIWANTLRVAPGRLCEMLQRDELAPEPLPWHPVAFRIACKSNGLGNHWTYHAGYFHIQEATSMIPVLVLSPQPGERILDLCAAPGNKTAQMALALENRGTIVANDLFYGRLRPLRSAIDRLGLLNITYTCHDGMSYPKSAGTFDCVLADVPCSCEGTSRKHPRVLKRSLRNNRLVRHQALLLDQAVRRCRDGGRIVYSTCTYAPEENEAIVDAALKKWDGRIHIRPIQVPGFVGSPGLTFWENSTFHPDLANTLRIWPHQNDTGGFYVALLEKTAGDSTSSNFFCEASQSGKGFADSADTDDLRPSPEIRETLLQELTDRFGLDREVFASLDMFINQKGVVHVAARNHRIPQMGERSTGLPLVRIGNRFSKLTTAGAAAFGRRATRNVIDVNPAQREAYLSRRVFDVDAQQTGSCDNGFVLVRYDGAVLGVGFYNRTKSTVESQYPKHRMLEGS